MGQIRQRGAVYWIRYYRDGKRHEETTHSTKEGAARRLLRLREGDIERGVPVTPKIGRLTFDDAAKDLLTDYKVNGKRSLEHVTRRVDQHLKPTFGGRRMAGITTTDVRAYIDKRQEEYTANASVNRELAALKRMYSLAIQAGKLLHRPHIPMLREDNVRQGFFERPAFESMRAHLPADVQPIATFAYLTGWRVQSEVLPLTWGQVDRTAGIVRLEANMGSRDFRDDRKGEISPDAECIRAVFSFRTCMESAAQNLPVLGQPRLSAQTQLLPQHGHASFQHRVLPA